MPEVPRLLGRRKPATRARLPGPVVTAMRSELPQVADEVVGAIITGVPAYQDALAGQMGGTIRTAVQLALDGFLTIVPRHNAPTTPRAPALDGAYQLGRGEARSGRTPEALLAAYRIGARTAWRSLSTTAVRAGIDTDGLAEFAELVFLYIDELSDASAAGHADQLATTGRVRQRLLEQLARQLLGNAGPATIDDTAERAGWEPPTTLTAVLVPMAQIGTVLPAISPATLVVDDVTDLLREPGEELAETALVLVPDVHGTGRAALLQAVRGRGSVVGPPKPWREVRRSYDRVLRAAADGLTGDTDHHLVTLLLSADPEARADLRATVLAPLADQRPATTEKLTATLRSWLLHQGRRDAVAADLYIHPQTVRYRMGQLRELYGDRLEDPGTLLALTVALA